MIDPKLYSLLAVVEFGSYTRAAEQISLTQPAVTHHMKQLVDAGIVEREQRGRWAYYRLIGDTLAALSGALRP